MKPIITILITILSLSGLHAQKIFDAYSQQLILDAVAVEGHTVLYTVNGTCGLGKIEAEDATTYVEYPFMVRGALSSFDNRWMALTAYREAEDVGEDLLELAYLDDSGETVRHTIEGVRSFSDFSYFDQNRVAILSEDKKRVYIHDLEGLLQKEQSLPTTIDFLESHKSRLYGVGKRSVYLVKEGEEHVHLALETDIQAYDFSADHIYLVVNDGIHILDQNLEIVRTIDKGMHNVSDVYFHGDLLYLLSTSQDASSINTLDLNGEEETFQALESSNINYTHFVKGVGPKQLYGQHTPNSGLHPYITHGVLMDLDKMNEDRYTVSVHVEELQERRDTLNVVTNPEGTYYQIRYSYPFKMVIENLSDQRIDDIRVVSNRKGATNCAYAQFSISLNDLSLEPGKSMEVDTVFDPYRSFEEVCLYAISVNGQVNRIDQDGTCQEISVSTDDVATASSVVIRPNPASTYIYIDADEKIETIWVYNSLGQLVKKENGYSSQKLDVSMLEKGMYHIKLQYMSGNMGTMGTFLKM